jgi:DNA polymerase
MKPERATIDFETRSACDLKKRGAWLYSKHASTEVLCLSYRLPHWPKREVIDGVTYKGQVKTWHSAHPALGIKATPPPEDLFAYIADGGIVEAHNSWFEFCIWKNKCVEGMLWPDIPMDQWRCSAAKAASHSLPRDLDGANRALQLTTLKSERGKYLLNKYCKPKKLNKKERAEFGANAVIFNEDAEGLAELWDYNRQDVYAEEALSDELPDLSPMELRIWQITNQMNYRGVLIDTELARSALFLTARAKEKLNAELKELTGIEAGSQRESLKEWLADKELVELTDTKAKTLEWYVEREEMSPRAKRVIEIMREVNRTSTNKYKRMLECVDDDDRARENLLYCGAERTGRFAGRGIQLHNMPKGKFAKWLKKALKGNTINVAVEDIKSRDLAWCEMIHGDVMNLLVSCLRGSIIAEIGRDLMTADYSAIEARCVLWEAGATEALKVFERGGDIYCDMASGIYGYTIVKDEDALALNTAAKIAAVINSGGSTQRDFGKVAVLGLGYGMGFLKFLITLRTYNIVLTREEVLSMMGERRLAEYENKVRRKLWPRLEDFKTDKDFKTAQRAASMEIRKLADEREDAEKVIHELALCKYTVDTYRRRYPEVPAMWRMQEKAAILAVQTCKPVKAGVVTWFVTRDGRFLKCRLPSGRCLNYANPQLKVVKTSWGEKKPQLRFMGINQKTKQWCRQATYGGKLTENITQAIARDIMAYAKIVVEDHPVYDLLLSVHDELMAEVDEGVGDRKEFEDLMISNLPAAFAGCPVASESNRYKRYRK